MSLQIVQCDLVQRSFENFATKQVTDYDEPGRIQRLRTEFKSVREVVTELKIRKSAVIKVKALR